MANPKVVILCMENRSFDQYFGNFPGAVGFDDPAGANVFPQPNGSGGTTRPFRASTFSTYTKQDPNHEWHSAQYAWNKGAMDGWYDASGETTLFNFSMSYFVGNDIPYHWRLAEMFLLCDTYACSVLGPTFSNRLYLMSGTIFRNVPANGSIVKFDATTDLPGLETIGIDSSDPGKFPPYQFPWQSFPSMLPDTASWSIYDDQYWRPSWLAWPTQPDKVLPPEYFTDKAWPANIQYDLNMLDGLYNRGDTDGYGGPGTRLADDGTYVATAEDAAVSKFVTAAESGSLPDVSWVIPPFFCTEHPQYLPADGECYLARIVDAIVKSPDWDDRGIVLIVTYDENGGFFDHVVPTTSRELDDCDEAWVSTDLNQSGDILAGPVGGGFRVPTLIISPWTVGAGLSSNVCPDKIFDHTSVIQYLETLTGAHCSNMPEGSWRRRTFANLESLVNTGNARTASASIGLPDVAEVDGWRVDALTRIFHGNPGKTPTPQLNEPSPPGDPTWPPVQQQCYLRRKRSRLDWRDVEALRKARGLGDIGPVSIVVCEFVAEGFEAAELNLGPCTPPGFSPIEPEIVVTIEPGSEGLFVVTPFVYEAVPGEGQTFTFEVDLVITSFSSDVSATLEISGSLTSRLCWTAPGITISINQYERDLSEARA